MCKMQLSLQPDILEIIPSRLLLKPAFPGRKPALSMYKQIGMGRSFFPMLLAVSFVLASSATGQEPAQSPDPSPDHSQTPQPEGGQDDRNREKDKSNETVGKSKIEKETGTINDRIFEVLPNYGTVENTKNLPPMTTRQKFRLATAGVFDWGSLFSPVCSVKIHATTRWERGASLTAPITPSIVFLSFERIQGIIDLTFQNRVAMPQPRQSPTFTMFQKIGPPLERSPRLPFCCSMTA